MSRVVAGAIAAQILSAIVPELKITAFTQAIGKIELPQDYTEFDLSEANIDSNDVRCPHPETARRMEVSILAARNAGDTVGGVIRCVVSGCPVGVGQPVFDKLSARLASAMMSINAAKGFQIGDGFALASSLGSQVMDTWTDGDPGCHILHAAANHSGGIQGGI